MRYVYAFILALISFSANAHSEFSVNVYSPNASVRIHSTPGRYQVPPPPPRYIRHYPPSYQYDRYQQGYHRLPSQYSRPVHNYCQYWDPYVGVYRTVICR